MDAVLTSSAAAPASSDTRRLEALFDAHQPRLYRLARRLCATSDDALDLVQDTFVRVASALDRVPHGAAAEEAWLVRVLVNLRRDAWRRAQVRAAYAEAARNGAEPMVDPADHLVAATTLWRALETLPPRRRAIVVLHELDDVPVGAVATTLGVSAVTVRWHLFRARAELARAIGADRRTP